MGRITKAQLIETWGFGEGIAAYSQLREFIQERELLNAWLEFCDNTPNLRFRKGKYGCENKEICEVALKALEDRDDKFCIQQSPRSKHDWLLGNHEVRFVVRVVQWCQLPNGLWSGEPLSKKLCEKAINLLRFLRYEMDERRRNYPDIGRAVNEGLEKKRRAEMGGQAQRAGRARKPRRLVSRAQHLNRTNLQHREDNEEPFPRSAAFQNWVNPEAGREQGDQQMPRREPDELRIAPRLDRATLPVIDLTQDDDDHRIKVEHHEGPNGIGGNKNGRDVSCSVDANVWWPGKMAISNVVPATEENSDVWWPGKIANRF